MAVLQAASILTCEAFSAPGDAKDWRRQPGGRSLDIGTFHLE